MRVIDPAWVGAKLRQIADFPEPRGDFLAWVPGERRQRSYPSTVAYIAGLLLHRYAMLGILDGDGYPVEPMGVVEDSEPAAARHARSAGSQEAVPGKTLQRVRQLRRHPQGRLRLLHRLRRDRRVRVRHAGRARR